MYDGFDRLVCESNRVRQRWLTTPQPPYEINCFKNLIDRTYLVCTKCIAHYWQLNVFSFMFTIIKIATSNQKNKYLRAAQRKCHQGRGKVPRFQTNVRQQHKPTTPNYTQNSTAEHNTTQHSSTQPNTAQHNAIQHNTGQQKTTHCRPIPPTAN